MIDEGSLRLLSGLLVSRERDALNAVQFRAKHYDQLERLDNLERNGFVYIRHEKYLIRLESLRKLSATNHRAESILYLCEHIFGCLKRWYLAHPGEQLEFGELVELVDMPKGKIQTALLYMEEAPVFDESTSHKDEGMISMKPSERMLRFETFDDFCEELLEQRRSYVSQEKQCLNDSSSDYSDQESSERYVDYNRMEQLQSLTSAKFDFSRVIQICNELNNSFANENLFAVGALLRALLDHVPPVFGYSTFGEVANNYGGRSIRGSLQHLDKSSRKISDSLLHQQIRTRENLPSRVMVNFSSDLDVLLAEMIRLVEEQSLPEDG